MQKTLLNACLWLALLSIIILAISGCAVRPTCFDSYTDQHTPANQHANSCADKHTAANRHAPSPTL
jgi:hypothetical protein